MEYLIGTEKGYISYRKYLAIDLDFRQGVSGMTSENDSIRLSKCKRESYSSNKFMRIFEHLSKKNSIEKLEKLFVQYHINFRSHSTFVTDFSIKDVDSYNTFLAHYAYEIEKELREILKKASEKNIFSGTPSELTKMVYSGKLRPETYLYLLLGVDLPASDDMVTVSCLEKIETYKKYFYYFTDKMEQDHVKKSINLLQKLQSEL